MGVQSCHGVVREPCVSAHPSTNVPQSDEQPATGSPHKHFEVMKLETGWLPKMVACRHVALRFRAKAKHCKKMSATKTVLGGDNVCVEEIDCEPWSPRLGSTGKDFPRTILLSVVGIKASSPKGGFDDVQIEDLETPKTIFSPCIEVCCRQCSTDSIVLVKRYMS